MPQQTLFANFLHREFGRKLFVKSKGVLVVGSIGIKPLELTQKTQRSFNEQSSTFYQ